MPKLKSLIGPRSGSDGKKDTSTLYRNITEPVKMNGITFCIVEPNAEIQGLLNILFDFGTKESIHECIHNFPPVFIAISSESMYAVSEEI